MVTKRCETTRGRNERGDAIAGLLARSIHRRESIESPLLLSRSFAGFVSAGGLSFPRRIRPFDRKVDPLTGRLPEVPNSIGPPSPTRRIAPRKQFRRSNIFEARHFERPSCRLTDRLCSLRSLRREPNYDSLWKRRNGKTREIPFVQSVQRDSSTSKSPFLFHTLCSKSAHKCRPNGRSFTFSWKQGYY